MARYELSSGKESLMQAAFPPHIPDRQRAALERIVQHVLAVMHPDKIILFGSYARGDFVEFDVNHEERTYFESDFDILVITKTESQANDFRISKRIEEAIHRDAKIRTPVSLLLEPLSHVNEQLSYGRYFYADIVREGVLLYERNDTPLAEAKELTPEEHRMLMQQDYDLWKVKADELLLNVGFNVANNQLNLAAFHLHQATESLYAAIQLIFTSYKPKIHDLKKLSETVDAIDPRFAVFERETPEGAHLFDLLRRAYIEARYDRNYTITAEELAVLTERVARLSAIAEVACREKMGE